jgi:phosphosulfolactate phosphohydrolase-like enzyme
VCASATARYLERSAPESLTLVMTGVDALRDGDEDVAFADYVSALLRGDPHDPTDYARRVRASKAASGFSAESLVFPLSDIDLASDVDRFDFALLVERTPDFLVMRAAR